MERFLWEPGKAASVGGRVPDSAWSNGYSNISGTQVLFSRLYLHWWELGSLPLRR